MESKKTEPKYLKDRRLQEVLRIIKDRDMRFPVAEIEKKMERSKGNVSSILKGMKPMSENFYTSFLRHFGTVGKQEKPPPQTEETMSRTQPETFTNDNAPQGFVKLEKHLALLESAFNERGKYVALLEEKVKLSPTVDSILETLQFHGEAIVDLQTRLAKVKIPDPFESDQESGEGQHKDARLAQKNKGSYVGKGS